MQVTCTHCNTSFNLPDEKAKIGAKLRCSQCKEVFKLEAPSEAAKPAKAPKAEADSAGALEMEVNADGSIEMEGFGFKSKKKKIDFSSKKVKLALLGVLLLGGVGFGVSMFLGGDEIVPPAPVANSENVSLAESSLVQGTQGTSSMPPANSDTAVPPPLMAPPLMSSPIGGAPNRGTDGDVHLMELRSVRQYTVNNEKIGKISVIEGDIVNGFNTPRELVKIEAILYGSGGNVIISKTQLAGTSVSLFQLQVLGREELEQALSNNIDVLTNNSNIQPEGRVPFMIIFYNPPQDASEFGVKVTDVKVVGQ